MPALRTPRVRTRLVNPTAPPVTAPTLTFYPATTAALRPVAPPGRGLHRATDTGTISLYDGGAWRDFDAGAELPSGGGAGDLLTGAGTWAQRGDVLQGMFADVGVANILALLGAARTTYGHTWERPSPSSVPAGSVFICSDDLAEQVSSGVALSAGVAASGWMRRLPNGLGPGRAALAGAPPRVYAESINLAAYTIGNVALAAMWTWDGSQPSSFGFSEIAMIGDSSNELRGIHVAYVTNGANTDLAVFTAGTFTVLIPSANLLAGAIGLHAIAIEPVDASGHKWRFSYDGSAVADVAMASPYVAPNSTDAVGLGSRPDGIVYLNGRAIELAVWGSLLSGADLVALATLPATPTYELPESASTGAAAIRVQACRYDPIVSPTAMPARGLVKVTVAPGTTKVTL